jgi:poly-gamma-glutamate synthesis protein (capsule biosynthesis protein)
MGTAAELSSTEPPAQRTMRLFLCGDVMLGRGIDQVLPHPCDPAIHESYLHSALDYVRLAEEANGAIPRPVVPSYIWGAALQELNRTRPDVRIINLESTITRSENFAPKGINYRVSPENADCLTAAAIHCCVLANNHVLDWGRMGLLDTLTALERLQIKTAGAGRNCDEALAPAALHIAGKGRVLVFSFAVVTSGTPRSWAATRDAPGVTLLTELSEATAVRIADQIARHRQPRDVIVVSIHWGPNWGYEIPDEQRHFAHSLIERADVSVIHGALMYFADIDPADRDVAVTEIVPLQIRKFSLVRPSGSDIDWVRQMLDRESREFRTSVALIPPGRLALSWPDRSTALASIERT